MANTGRKANEPSRVATAAATAARTPEPLMPASPGSPSTACAGEASAARPGFVDATLHVELAVEISRVGVAIFDALAAQQAGEHFDVVAVELRA